MVTYQERKENTRVYVIIEGETVLGVFRNLTKACEFMKGKDFPSYWTVARKKQDRFDYGKYSIQKLKLI
jgi:hypothetical protein